MENNWKDLFIISLVQWMVPIHLIDDKEIALTIERATKNNEINGDEQIECLENFKLIKEMVMKLISLNLDQNEIEHFKLLALMRYGMYKN